MTIKEVIARPINALIDLRALVASNDLRAKQSGGAWMNLILQDNTGNISAPVWDAAASSRISFPQGRIVDVRAIVSAYKGVPQLRIVSVEQVDPQPSLSDFVPSYEGIEGLEEYLLAQIKSLSSPWNVLLIEAFRIVTWQSFRECPAAKSHHGNRVGGTMVHTAQVLRNIDRFIDMYSGKGSSLPHLAYFDMRPLINADRLRFLAIFHDIAKVYEYKWNPCVDHDPACKTNHRDMSTSLLMLVNYNLGNLLSMADYQSVAYDLLAHHGTYGEYEPNTLEGILLHLADNLDAQIVGFIEQPKEEPGNGEI